MTAARLSDPARAVVAYVRRRGSMSIEQLLDEFIRRGRYPEDITASICEALAAGAIVQDGDQLRAGPTR